MPRRVIEWALRRQNVLKRIVQLIKALYVNTNSNVNLYMKIKGIWNKGWCSPRVGFKPSAFHFGNGGRQEKM